MLWVKERTYPLLSCRDVTLTCGTAAAAAGELEGCRWGIRECKPSIWLGGLNPQVQMFAGCQNCYSDMGQTQAFTNVSCKNYASSDIYPPVPSSYSLACRCLLRADPALLLDQAEQNLKWLSHCLSNGLNMILAFYPCLFQLSALHENKNNLLLSILHERNFFLKM